jgi:tight adherence protein C
VAAVGLVAIASAAGVAAAQRRRRLSEERILASLPETIDLFMLAAGSGQPVQRALAMVASRAVGPVGHELRAAARRVELGARTGDALEAAASALGDSVRPLVGVLCASERYGTPLVPALERLALEARNDRRRRAEESARRVPVKLLFPLVLCTLPAFALLTVVPLLIGAFGSLRL